MSITDLKNAPDPFRQSRSLEMMNGSKTCGASGGPPDVVHLSAARCPRSSGLLRQTEKGPNEQVCGQPKEERIALTGARAESDRIRPERDRVQSVDALLCWASPGTCLRLGFGAWLCKCMQVGYYRPRPMIRDFMKDSSSMGVSLIGILHRIDSLIRKRHDQGFSRNIAYEFA
jgi:hypothetical protein